jgi:hypothetical protein
MRYELCDIEKIVEFTTWSDRKKLDELLRIDCSQYTNLGCDSTKLEREQVKRNSRKIYRLIKSKIDNQIGTEFLMAMDN